MRAATDEEPRDRAADRAANDPAAPAAPDPSRLRQVPYPVVLPGQPALVTGANSGIGEAVALGLAQAGADVVVNYVTNPQAAEDVAHRIEGFGRRAIALKADVGNEEDVRRMFARAIEHFGTLHIVVCNAGLQRDSAFAAMTLEQWNTVLSVNLTGQFLCAREAAREFQRRGVAPEVSLAAGKILCMGSVHQRIPWAGHANYAASKGGVMMLMKSIAQELAPRRIRVNGIAPGAIRRPDDARAVQADRRTRRRRARRGLARLGRGRLRHRNDALRGRRNDALPRLRHRRLSTGPA